MKKLLLIAVLIGGAFTLQAQNNDALVKHYEAFYKQMKSQGDVQGIINAMTHLNVLSPSEARRDTLAYVYMSNGNHLQALNTIGIDSKPTDSDIAVEVKAISLKAAGEVERAIIHFEEMFKRQPNPHLAYELAELNLQTQKLAEATKHIQYAEANVKDDMNKAFYETQQPYQVPLKAALMYLKALVKFNENTATNIDPAVDVLDEALKIAPNFNMAQTAKNALLAQKAQPQKQD